MLGLVTWTAWHPQAQATRAQTMDDVTTMLSILVLILLVYELWSMWRTHRRNEQQERRREEDRARQSARPEGQPQERDE